jgi:TRAP-type C4-dicarboxylate transport system permease small subunit
MAAPDAQRAAPAWLAAALRGVDRLAVAGGWIAAALLAGLTVLILAEISVRTASNIFPKLPGDVPMAWEISSYMMGGAFAFGLALTLRAGGHVRVALIMAALPKGLARGLESVTCLLGLGLTGFLAWAMIRFTWRNFERGQVSVSSDIPTWIPQSLICLGLSLLALQMLARLVQAVLALPVEDHGLKVASLAE